MKIISFLCLISAIVLIIAAIFHLPYGYYTLVRLFITITALYIVFNSYKNNTHWATVLFIVVSVLFNPIEPIFLKKQHWLYIDLIVSFFYLLIMILPFIKKKSMDSEFV